MLELKNVYFSYGEGYVLNGISAQIERGHIVGILGLNGAGKTTLINCIAGILKPVEGQITLDGVSGEKIRDNIAYVSSDGCSVFNFTPREFGEYLADFYPKFKMKRYENLIDYFDLPDAPISTFSKGQKGKTELAAGCSKGVDYILMDEPFIDKDIFTRKDFIKILAGSLKENETIILCTHFVEETQNLMDRVLVINEGKIAMDIDMGKLEEDGGNIEDEMQRILNPNGKKKTLNLDD